MVAFGVQQIAKYQPRHRAAELEEIVFVTRPRKRTARPWPDSTSIAPGSNTTLVRMRSRIGTIARS